MVQTSLLMTGMFEPTSAIEVTLTESNHLHFGRVALKPGLHVLRPDKAVEILAQFPDAPVYIPLGDHSRIMVECWAEAYPRGYQHG